MEKIDLHKKVQHISCRRWFNPREGNTYHTATLHYPDGSAVKSEIQYGYGEQCLQTAYDMMQIKPYRGTLGLREDYGISYDIADVARKRDL